MAMIGRGSRPHWASGRASVSPEEIFSADRRMAWASTLLPADPPLISRARSRATPLWSSVPSTRQKRETAALRKIGPATGIFSFQRSATSAPALRPQAHRRAKTAARQPGRQEQTVLLQPGGERQQGDGRPGQPAPLLLEPFEQLGELGYEEQEQDQRHARAGNGEDRRIRHGADHFPLQLLLEFEERGGPFQGVLEESAFGTGPDEAHRQLSEDLGMAGEGRVQRLAFGNAVADVGEDFRQFALRRLLGEDVQCLEYRHPVLQQVGQLQQVGGHRLGLDPPPGPPPRPPGGDGIHAQREELLLRQRCERFALLPAVIDPVTSCPEAVRAV